MKKILVILTFLISLNSFGQSENYQDSLQAILNSSATLEQKMEAKFMLGEHLVQRNPEKAELFADELATEPKVLADSLFLARNNFIYAASHRWQGNYATALDYYQKNYSFFTRKKDKANIAKSGHFIGTINTFLGNNVLAQKHLLEVAEIYDEIGSPKQKARINNSLAGFYLNIDQLEKGKDKYLLALEQFETLNDSSGMASINANLGLVYTELGNYEQAEKHLLKQKSLNVVFPTLREMGFHHDFMGVLRQEQDRIPEAYEEHLKALKIRENLSSTYNLCESKLNMGKVLIKMGRHNEAMSHLNDVLSFEEHGSLNQEQRAHELLAEAAEKKGDYAVALQSYKSYKAISDSIYSKESIDIIAEKDANYKKKEQDAEIALLSSENEANQAMLSRQRIIVYGSLAGLLFFSLFAVSLFTLNKKIKAKNTMINKALHQKELLMQEIHHRVKNNLQIISSLLKLQSKFIEDDSALEAIHQGRNRVQSMAILHRNLYTEDDVTTVNMKEYFSSLIQSIFNSYNLTEDQVKLNLEVEELKLDVDSVIPMGLIINELITNSLKHAFTESHKEHAQIDVKLSEFMDQYRLIVSDNGKGVEDGVLELTNNDSFGQRMISAFVQKLKATMQVNNSDGTEVTINIPKAAVA